MKNKYWIFRSDNYVGVLGIIFAVLVAVLIFLSFKYDKEHCTLWGCDDSVYLQEEMNEVNVKNTYTYTNHGFSIELPTGFTPVEKDWQNGQGTDITMPDGAGGTIKLDDGFTNTTKTNSVRAQLAFVF